MRKTCLSLVTVALLGLAVVACGGEDEDAAPPRASKGGGKAKPKIAAAGPAAVVADPNRVPLKLREVNWEAESKRIEVRNARDPFQPYLDEMRQAVDESAGPGGDTEIRGNLTRFSVEELKLIGIITGTAVNKAMMIDPAGLGHVVRVGEVIGKVPMRVARITRNEVLFQPLQAPTEDQPAQELRRQLLTQEELEELLP